MPRRDITDRTTLDDAYFYVAYVADALSLAAEDGDKEVGALHSPVEKLLPLNDALSAERRARRRAIGRSNALVRRRDFQLDGATTDLHNDTLGFVKQDRTRFPFEFLFSDALSRIVRMALGSQLPVARALLNRLGTPEVPAELKKAHEKPLGAAIEKGQHAIEGREEAFAAAGRTTARVDSWREDANLVLRGVEGALQQIAAKRRLKADWVDSFFPAPERREAADAPAPAAPDGDASHGG